MHRHRNPSNGYRSSPMGIGIGGAGVAPGYRGYNRGGFGRGQAPPPRRIDVFMEAGKLAAEYLVSKGLVPPSSGNGKWQSSNLKASVNDVVSDGVSGASSGRRRFSDEGIRDMRTLEREVKRSESLSENVRGLSEKEGGGDSVSGSVEERKSGKDDASEERKSVSGDLESKSYDVGNKISQSADENVDVKTPMSEERTEGLKEVNVSTDDVAMDDSNSNAEGEKPVVEEEEVLPDKENNKSLNDKSSDLLSLIRFNKIPTRTRSSVTLKGSKSDPVLISGDENMNKQDDENKGLNHEPEPEPKIEQVPSEDVNKYEFGQGLQTRSLSFPQRSFVSDQELNEGQHGYARSSSLSVGEKRPLQVDDSAEAAKKPRDWTSENPQVNEFFHISSSRERTMEDTPGITQPCNSYAEEKQLFPSSFKICDLNSLEASDVRDKHDTNSVAGFSSLVQAKQEPVSIDFDLTMNSSCHMTDRHGKGVEVIDLDCDSMQEDENIDNGNNNSERREEAIFTGLESFQDSMQRVSDMPQDGYGLMISELLDADIPNSSVSTGVNSMHNEMGLPNEEGMLNDDESIYMSLGEIPISFVPVWDQQPSQGYDKRY